MRAWVLLGMVATLPAMALAQDRSPGPRGSQDRVRSAFTAVDTDRDGFVTRAEADAARQRLRERMQAQARERRDRGFARLDANKDGAISRAEFDSAPRMAMMRMPRRPAQAATGLPLFERMDADRDGRVSLAEAEAAVDRRYAMRGGRRGAGTLPPGHPPIANPRTPMMEDGSRPLGGGRN